MAKTLTTAAILLASLAARGALADKPSTPAAIQVQCSNPKSGSVTIRWGKPNHDSTTLIGNAPGVTKDGYFHTPCGPGSGNAINSTAFKLDASNSEYEIQTQGGHGTAYTIKVVVNAEQSPQPNTITLVHPTPPGFTFNPNAVTLKRTAGPNDFGEQNFRVTLPAGKSVTVRGMVDVTGANNAKMTLRWGTPNHDKTPVTNPTLLPFRLGSNQSIGPFTLSAGNSEFEIQTQGGMATAYHLRLWFDAATTTPPTIDVLNRAVTQTDVYFTPTSGNDYGERNVRVTAPWLPGSQTTPPNGGGTGTGTTGIAITYNYGGYSYSALNKPNIKMAAQGSLMTAAAPAGTGMTKFQDPEPGTLSVSSPTNPFPFTENNLAPGKWNISVSTLSASGAANERVATCTVNVIAGQTTNVTLDWQKTPNC